MEILKECELCGAGSFSPIVQPRDYLISNKHFTIVRCQQCGFVFTNPRPSSDELPGYYASSDYISHTDSEKNISDKVYQMVRRHMLNKKIKLLKSSLRRDVSTTSLLDYGCATGEFLLKAQEIGMNAHGYEPDLNARQKALEKGLNLIEDLEDLKSHRSNRAFDVITLWHVLEHIPDLKDKVKIFKGIIAENGLIVVAVPEYKSFDAKIYKDKWAAWDVPRHLNHFEKKSLCQLFSGLGFRLEKIYPLYYDSYYISMLSEKQRGSGIMGLVRAFGIGFYSNMNALLKKRPFSSQIYFFRKNSE